MSNAAKLLDDAIALNKRVNEILANQQAALDDARTFAVNTVAAHQEVDKMRDERDREYRKAIIELTWAADVAARKYGDQNLATVARKYEGLAQ